MKLSTGDFVRFHQAVHRCAPFPWQARLLDTVVAERAWPKVLDVPTGAGKTTCIDIALFALALDASVNAPERWCPRRIAMVVDRRVVVDQVAERGRRLLRALLSEQDPVVVEVARRLRTLSHDEAEPLRVFTLRGGVPKDDGWARVPDQPLIIASTVDQLGSRLFMQGYGVTDRMKPVHAGLAGNDLLLLLDEVHLSRPFAERLEQLARLRTKFEKQGSFRSRFHFAQLSATPGKVAGGTFSLEEREREASSTLGRRLYATKPARLTTCASEAEIVATSVAEARVLLERHDVVAVIVNRVARASAVATQLREGAGGTLEVVLLTGRMRPLDRDDVLASLRPRIMTGRERTGDGRKLVVVATQCIEAGADFDFDAMVTECASLDALRQRFGRVDRLGLYARAEGVVICDWSAKDDPIYGTALGATFKWLDAHAEKKKGVKTFDFAVATFPPLSDADVATLFAAKPHAPVLLPAYLDLWSQTSPPPAQVPDLTLWLHGPATSPADVQVVWRADVTDELLDAAARGADESEAGSVEALVDVVGSVRPTSLETLSLPFGVARAWLSGGAVGPMSDVEGDAAEEDHALSGGGRRALLWRGDESRVVRAEEIRPGDTMIVPASRGGLLQGIFEPDATAAVQDLAERATLFGRGLPLLRLHPAILDGLGLPSTWATDEEDVRVAVAAAAVDVAGWRRPWLTALARSSTDRVVVAGDATWTVLEARRLAAPVLRDLVTPAETVEDSAEATTDDEDSPFLGRAVGLREHSIDVEMLARAYATSLGLPHELISDLALAGWLHDIGKADPRFQLLLRGGDEIAWLRDDSLLAKSGISDQDRARQRRARARSGYPAGTRHELQSVAMIEAALGELRGRAHDLDLVLHLVASHHGFCRPLAPASIEVAPVEIAAADHVNTAEETVRLPPTTTDHGLHRVDSPIPGRYWELVQKYGWQELCWLESILRLADHRASEHEQQKGGAGQ